MFEHSVQCSSCNNRNCQNIKRLVHHGQLCKFINEELCPIYSIYFESLKLHTEDCTEANCPLEFCSYLKNMINQYRLLQAQSLWTTTITGAAAAATTNEHLTSITNDTH